MRDSDACPKSIIVRMRTMNKVDMVLGAQFGDEGKGRIVDFLCSTGKYTACARVNGSDNAGHTVILESGDRIAFNQLPIGVIHGMDGVIARGCVVDLDKLDAEIADLDEFTMKNSISNNWALLLDSRCHVKTQDHRIRDAAEEEIRRNPIGTTLSGNGPAHADKYARKNERVCDQDLSPYRNIQRHAVVTDTSHWINSHLGDVLVEGAHGVMLDIDHGTYPFVSSSGCTAAYACHSLGISPSRIRRVIGVTKPYVTRVGAGAFPTKMDQSTQDWFREVGKEYGTVTQRPRRIGWLDLPALVYAIRVAGITEIALTKVDVLDNFEGSLQVGIGYAMPPDSASIDTIPARDEMYAKTEVAYFPIAWSPLSIATLVRIMEDKLSVPITLLSRSLHGIVLQPQTSIIS